MAGIHTVDLTGNDAASALDVALAAHGFVQLIGHGVDLDLVADLWRGMDDLFAQPDEVRNRWINDDPLANRGLRRRGSEALSYSLGRESPPDLFESFNLGHDDRADPSEPLLAPNVWPETPAGFGPAARAWLARMAALAAELDGLVGPTAGMPDLADRSRAGPDTMACIRYERSAAEQTPAPDQMRMGAHSDYTLFTILCADAVPGLEILGPDGRWLPVTPEPGALLLNVGDLLAIATNDRWPSTLHRVPIPAGDAGVLRRSVAYFHYPDLDQTIHPPPGSAYRPTTVRDHLRSRLVGPKIHESSADGATLAGRSIGDPDNLQSTS